MAAPTNAANVKKALANSEPSTHGTNRKWLMLPTMSGIGCEADSTVAAADSNLIFSGDHSSASVAVTVL
jgi:hypothetical protein